MPHMKKVTLQVIIRFLQLDERRVASIIADYVAGVDMEAQAIRLRVSPQVVQKIVTLAVGCKFGRGYGLNNTHGYVLPEGLLIVRRGSYSRNVVSRWWSVSTRKPSARTLASSPDFEVMAQWIKDHYGPEAYWSRERLGKEILRRWRGRRELVGYLLQLDQEAARVAEYVLCAQTTLIDDLRRIHGFVAAPVDPVEALMA